MSKRFERALVAQRIGRLAPSILVWLRPFALILALVGCVNSAPSRPVPPSRALGAEFQVFRAPEEIPIASEAPRLREPESALSLREALTLSLLQNPDLAAFSWESRAREADALQAGILPNPELSVDLENVAGSGLFNGSDLAETTVRLGQLIELGGKRSKRSRVANLERDLADWDYEVRRLDVLTAVAQEFVSVLESQKRVALAGDRRNLANEALSAVIKRVRSGAASSFEETRAHMNLVSSELAERRDIGALSISRARLASLWGARSPSFDHARGDFDAVFRPPRIESIQELLANNPDVARWASELALREAVVRLENARGVPNVTVGGGVRRFEESDDSALVFGISIPFPVFDRNQGARKAARLRRLKVRSQEQAAVLRAAGDLTVAHLALVTSYDAVVELREEMLSQAGEAYSEVLTSYQSGLLPFEIVVHAQRLLHELREDELSALGQFHRAAAEVERLIGTPLSMVERDPAADARN